MSGAIMVHCGHKGMDIETLLRSAAEFKLCSVGTQEKLSCSQCTASLNCWYRRDGAMLSCCSRHTLILPSECRRRNRDSKDVSMLFYFAVLVRLWNAALGWQQRHPVWTSASKFNMLCTHRCSSAGFGCYLTYRCLSVSLNQSGHSPLTPDISKARYWITVAHWIFFFQSDLCKH